MKKHYFVFVMLTAVSLLNTVAFAGDYNSFRTNDNVVQVQPRYTTLVTLDNEIQIKNSGISICSGGTKVKAGYRAGIKIELQRYDKSWVTIKSWSADNDMLVNLSKQYYITKGYSYRLKTTHSAINSYGKVLESYIKYSSVKSY